VMEHPDYYKLREQLIEFLEVRAHRKPAPPDVSPPPAEKPTPAIESETIIKTQLNHA